MKRPIKRTTTLALTLLEAAEALGFKDWGSENEYLDADPHEDVYHSGYSKKDVTHFDEVIPGANEIFPLEVAIALEDAERDAWASAITKARLQALISAFEKISDLDCEYLGQSSEGEEVSVSVKGGITGVELDVPNNCVQVTIENPEHLINTIINGRGIFYPTEIHMDVAANDEVLKRYFIGNIGAYFSIYGESRPEDELPSNYHPEIDEEFYKEEIKVRIRELSPEQVAERIIDAVEEGRAENVNTAIKAACNLTEMTKIQIKAALREVSRHHVEKVTQKMKKFAS